MIRTLFLFLVERCSPDWGEHLMLLWIAAFRRLKVPQLRKRQSLRQGPKTGLSNKARHALHSNGCWLRPACSVHLLASLLFLLPFNLQPLVAAPQPEFGKIEIIRDRWGIPHVFSDTDAGAMYGLGYITAQERGFQMTYSLRIIQGRLAEILGDQPKISGNETALAHDRKMRTFGWARAAERVAAHLAPETRQLLEAYAVGVNDSFAAQKTAGALHPLFERLGVAPEPWKAADCLLSWWHLAQFFATDGTRELIAWRNQADPNRARAPQQSPAWLDEDAAVVQREDVSEEWLKQVQTFSQRHGLPPTPATDQGPKFSHAWVVGGKKSSTGSAILVSDPQTPVRNPSLWMEFHISGKTFNARGIGVPGSPGLLIGFNPRVAWGLTALGADQADLFRLETSPEHENAYRWNGQWRSMQIREEEIKIKGGASERLRVRETHLGPVVSEFCFAQPADPEVALKRVPLCDAHHDTVEATFGMLRARHTADFVQAARAWRFPSANCVFGDATGDIGYLVLGAIPVRARSVPNLSGAEAMPGSGDSHDWQGFVPAELLPHVFNPKSGVLFSANHRPIGGFYPIPLGTSTGSMGDTIRSWRLRERLTPPDRFTPEDVLKVHYDSVNPARREIVRLGVHLNKSVKLSDDAAKALTALEPWLGSGASSDLQAPGAELAARISTFFRFTATPLAAKFGGGESGLARFLKNTGQRLTDPTAKFNEDEVQFIDKVLADAWRTQTDRDSRTRRGPAALQPLGWFESLDGFGSLDRSQDLPPPSLRCTDGQTIVSQAAQSYTQWVPLHDADGARSICPIGHSDRPASPYRTSTLSLWSDGQLHPAPLSRAAVEKIAAERIEL